MAILIAQIAHLVRHADLVEHDCDLLIEGNRVAAIGPKLDRPEGCTVLDGRGCAVIPGLISAHTHLYQSLLKGVSGGLSLLPWCDQVLFPTVRVLRQEAQQGNQRPSYLWTAMATVEMIRGGITCCQDLDLMHEGMLQAWRELGFRGVAAYTLANRWIPANVQSEEQRMREKALSWVERFHRPEGRITVALGPSAPFLCSNSLLEWCVAESEARDLGLHIHASETAEEVSESHRDHGMSPLQRLRSLGCLRPRTSVVHCVHLDETDRGALAEQRVQVVHCPKSNMKLADGVAPVPALVRAGASVSLGTDGAASNDLLDMWEEMRVAALLGRVGAMDAAALSAADVFRMATEAAARACRVEAGVLEPGRLADVAVIELSGAHLRPLHDPVSTLVFCGRADDVRDTIIDGALVMRDRHVLGLDEAELFREAEEYEAAFHNQERMGRT